MDHTIECFTASNALIALELLTQSPPLQPDFIFLDLNMPRINGRQCLAEIKKIPHLANTPVIIYTTSSPEKDKIETLYAGASGFITKPSDIPHLTELLSQLFQSVILNQKLNVKKYNE
jgi:CheY-like chemotaxis protein